MFLISAMKSNILFGIIMVMVVALASCKSSKQSALATNTKPVDSGIQLMFRPGPQVIVYKTKKDYSNLVAVTLSEDRKLIVSYPDPSDIKKQENLGRPIALEQGYLWDQRGLALNTGYLSITLEEYAAMPKAPSIEMMLGKLVEANPFIEIWNCGIRSEKVNKEALNKLISTGELAKKAKPIAIKQ